MGFVRYGQRDLLFLFKVANDKKLRGFVRSGEDEAILFRGDIFKFSIAQTGLLRAQSKEGLVKTKDGIFRVGISF